MNTLPFRRGPSNNESRTKKLRYFGKVVWSFGLLNLLRPAIDSFLPRIKVSRSPSF